MANDHTTTGLISDIKRKQSIPVSQGTVTNTDIVEFLQDEMESTITPMIMDINEEFFVTYIDYTVATGDLSFAIPSNALGMRLRDVVLVTNAGTAQESMTNLPRLNLSQISALGYSNNTYGYQGFLLEGNNVKLYPADGFVNETLRLYYYKRPNQLVTVNSTGKIQSIDPNNKILTLDNVPTTWTTSNTVDVIDDAQPFQNLLTNIAITNISGFDITVSSVTDIAVDDYVALTGESPIPQITVEGHQLLMQSAIIMILDSFGDQAALKNAVSKYNKIEKMFLKTITPRVKGQSIKIVNRNNIFNYINDRGFYN